MHGRKGEGARGSTEAFATCVLMFVAKFKHFCGILHLFIAARFCVFEELAI